MKKYHLTCDILTFARFKKLSLLVLIPKKSSNFAFQKD
jgi:hypothetical protein